MINKLAIFDFDGTLFNSPTDTPEVLAKYQKATGLPWVIDKETSKRLSREHGRFISMRRGWWGRGETLEPPLVPDPAPPEWFIPSVRKDLEDHMQSENAVAVILTGRHAGLKKQVLRICRDGKLFKIEKHQSKGGEVFYEQADDRVAMHFLGDNGPKPSGNKPSETFPWKVWIIEQYLGIYDSVQLMEVWEDRPEHVVKFQELSERFGLEVKVNHIT